MSENGNGNAAHILREAARRKVYRELKFSDFDPGMEGSVKVRVSLSHAENKQIIQLRDDLTAKSTLWRELPQDEGHKAEREALEAELQSLANDWLAFVGSLIVDSELKHPEGLSREAALSFFHGQDEEANQQLEDWVKDSVGAMVQEFRQEDFLARRTHSAAGQTR